MVLCCAVVLVALRLSAGIGVEQKPISYCIPPDSMLARTERCECHVGGRGVNCGQSNNQFDLVCSDLPDIPLEGRNFTNVTCL